MKIEFGREPDIEMWMNLVNKVKSSFPGLETKEALDEHRQTVLTFMRAASAICAKTEEQIVGALLFSREENMLCFLAVDEQYRRQHIAERMVQHMLSCMNPEKEVIVTTYREEVPEGIAARAFYKRLGFDEGERTEEFGAPVQEFILKR